MTRRELKNAVQDVRNETHDALQTVYNELNKGQKQKILKNEVVRELFERYGVEVTE